MIENLPLKMEKLISVMRIGGELIPDIECNQFVDELGDTIIRGIARIATYEAYLAQYPDGAWQAFKERWYPNWLKLRFPTRFVKVYARHKFPQYTLQLGKEFVDLKYIKDIVQ